MGAKLADGAQKAMSSRRTRKAGGKHEPACRQLQDCFMLACIIQHMVTSSMLSSFGVLHIPLQQAPNIEWVSLFAMHFNSKCLPASDSGAMAHLHRELMSR